MATGEGFGSVAGWVQNGPGANSAAGYADWEGCRATALKSESRLVITLFIASPWRELLILNVLLILSTPLWYEILPVLHLVRAAGQRFGTSCYTMARTLLPECYPWYDYELPESLRGF